MVLDNEPTSKVAIDYGGNRYGQKKQVTGHHGPFVLYSEYQVLYYENSENWSTTIVRGPVVRFNVELA